MDSVTVRYQYGNLLRFSVSWCSRNKVTLELYRQGILPQGHTEKITIEIGGKRIGKFVIVDFRYPNDHSGMITITLQKIRQKA